MPSIYDILTGIRSGNPERVWREKMLHAIPETESVERVPFLVERCQGRVVLNLGSASGDLHDKLAKAADRIYALDKEPTNQPTTAIFNLDSVNGSDKLPFCDLPIDLIVAGELFEHLANPGWLLQRLSINFPSAEVVITVPNYQSAGGGKYIRQGIECVNRDHVAWYSWRTLLTLVERYGYVCREWRWYNGEPRTAEGLIFCIGQQNGSH
jgi:hypothetical protein